MNLHFHLIVAAVSVLNHIPVLPLFLRASVVHFIFWIETKVAQLPLSSIFCCLKTQLE